MSDSMVRLDIQNGIAILTLSNPPVNALSHALRTAFSVRLVEVARNTAVEGLVIACAGRTFVDGAEISELGQVNTPMLREIISRLESMGKPSVAALHGTALGGGLELALGCTFRVANQDAKIGLPEVKLGLLPGAGGTVRTTYLAGAKASLELAGSGEMMRADAAGKLGLIDAVFAGDLIANAVRFLQRKISENDIPAPVSQRAGDMPSADPAALEKLAAELCQKARSSAPMLTGQAVKAALELDFARAMQEERRLFDEAVASPRSEALRHLFFAERAAAKLPEDVAEAGTRSVQAVGVIGAGTMGSGIAMAFANSGYDVIIREMNAEALQRGLERVATTYARSVSRGSLTRNEADRRIARIEGTDEAADLAKCDLIVEAAFEDMEVKKSIFAELDRIARPGAILATNTSYLNVDAIAAATSRPGDVLGLHFFSPANVMKLVEVVRGAETAPNVLATALGVSRKLRKQPVVVGVCHGFVGNRMLAARNAQLSQLLLEGATPAQVDGAFRALGWPMGPCQMQDLAGLDISWRNRKALGTPDALPDRLCELGRFGQKAGKGWYLYDGNRERKPDPEVQVIIDTMAAERGITRKLLSENEIIDRTHGPMITEGRRILEEGIAVRSSDIDVIWVHGYGFPRDLGGPMFWDDKGRLRTKGEI
ncbi:3-hydroxyacyl-CoA dehydrogenase NAD-binding domain-containing protein [Cognatishimia sp. D5M38]|jgi:3-hydroxyacyl-CoA dehydrogenase|uniref:3-hydroxyacyl-CoA dehydrogenase NAD-binding domain-containing protein n=1 Tax=Cognatishimia coralii TaxID=3083254 RepID=A0ABU8QKD2_9RHOB|nr:3-hydroxyacyl-CoA dehydrogenase NAD-binding domain-containing protein [Donghicola eburneus]MCI5038173.1 3-hydroxyacyl-CoA dehydrogenase NAD-binding domain-containing protein [Donghicola eburneus]